MKVIVLALCHIPPSSEWCGEGLLHPAVCPYETDFFIVFRIERLFSSSFLSAVSIAVSCKKLPLSVSFFVLLFCIVCFSVCLVNGSLLDLLTDSVVFLFYFYLYIYLVAVSGWFLLGEVGARHQCLFAMVCLLTCCIIQNHRRLI